MITKVIVTAAILLVLVLGLRVVMPRFGSSVATGIQSSDGQSLLGDCPSSPNCQCSEASRESQRVDRFTINGDADKAIETLADIVRGQAGMAIVKQDERYLHATATTSLMRYVDDVEFLLSDDGGSVQVRSASRLGESDLGANAKRIALLRELASGVL